MKTVGKLARDKTRDKAYFDNINKQRAQSPKKKAKIEYVRLKLLRKKQLQQWNAMTEEEQCHLRSMRAKAGVKCSKCGRVGFYLELCPSGCYEAAQQIQSYDTDEEEEDAEEGNPKHPGAAHFWGNAVNSPPPKASLDTLKDQMKQETLRLRGTDEHLLPYMFFADAGLGYANDMSELTLHQVLRYIIRLLENEIANNVAGLEAEVDVTLFHPPKTKPGPHFYPASLGNMKEYRDYFSSIEAKKDRDAKVWAARQPNPNAGESMHSKIGWKSVLSTGDNLAVADPAMAKQMAKLAKYMKKQAAWTGLQKKDFEYTVDRYSHLAHLVKEEMKREHDREVRLLTAPEGPLLKDMEIKVFKERIAAADRIMETVMTYEFINGTGKADFLVFCLSKYKNGVLQRYSIHSDKDDATQISDKTTPVKPTQAMKNAPSPADTDDDTIFSAESATQPKTSPQIKKAVTLSRVDEIKQYTKSLKRVPNHTMRLRIADKGLSKKVAKNYKEIDMARHIRSGCSNDVTTLAPVLIPLHAVLDEKNPNEIPKSHTASQILHNLNLQRIDPISGYSSRKYVPLYVRSTLMEPNGTSPGGDQMYETLAKDRRYSPHIGRSLAALEPPDLHSTGKQSSRKTSRMKKNGGVA